MRRPGESPVRIEHRNIGIGTGIGKYQYPTITVRTLNRRTKAVIDETNYWPEIIIKYHYTPVAVILSIDRFKQLIRQRDMLLQDFIEEENRIMGISPVEF